ncbi:MAG: hypothetical protein HYY02_04590 [Chloroflexi bacterium]|nr:hypothetical protein [Chloroflexota bacterium]
MMKNLLFRRQEGQALPIVMLVLAFGAAILVPANVYANTVLIAQRNAKLSLIDAYSAEACNTYAMWRLLWVSDTDTSTVTCNLNGITATVNIAVVPPSNIISATATVSVNESVPANNELWAVANIPQTAKKDASMAYDTVGAPARVSVPFTTSPPCPSASPCSITYYFHNNPTPPVADSAVLSTEYTTSPYLTNQTMTTAAPTATTLYNYDTTSPDTRVGRWVKKNPQGSNCAGQVLYDGHYRVVWRSPVISPTSFTINGTVTFIWWWSTEDGSALNSGDTENFVWWICKYDPTIGISVPLKNPFALGSGASTGTSAMWVKPFDLKATAGSRGFHARVDKVSATAIAVRSNVMCQVQNC